VERRVFCSREAEQAWNRRRADLRSLDDVAQELSEVIGVSTSSTGELPNLRPVISPSEIHSDGPLI
jgi:hypothetical protein